MSQTLRAEYPRPNFVRHEWLNLNGPWRFAFDDEDRGVSGSWYSDSSPLSQTITVPFAYQTPASSINVQEHHNIVWYARHFDVPADWADKRLLLHFGAADYETTVWVNGKYVGQHRGGNVPFRFNITKFAKADDNHIAIRIVDEPRYDQPRGKQTAREGPWACWYTPVTGIWQTVWLEPVSQSHIEDLHLVPDVDNESLKMKYKLSDVADGLTLETTVTSGDEVVVRQQVPVPKGYTRWSDITPVEQSELHLSIPAPKLWSPEHPHLYDMVVRLLHNGEVVDEVKTYFGMRKVHVENGEFFLNNRPYYQRLILDQGYWQEGLYTAPSVDAIKKDVELTKAMGFNGARKHQKIEDPYYYYFCDRLGLLVWSEMPAAYEYSETAACNITAEWQQAVLRDRNHPSIVAWVPINESWGVDQLSWRTLPEAEAHLMALYYATHALDGTRPVISNDGWEHALTDMITIHDYTQDGDDLRRRLNLFLTSPYGGAFSHGRVTLLPGYENEGAPILVTEFGGVKVEAQQAEGWGYGQAATDFDEMVERIRGLVQAIVDEPSVVGYCYTQLTDVQQEVNGLLTVDRQPKVDVSVLKDVFRGR